MSLLQQQQERQKATHQSQQPLQCSQQQQQESKAQQQQGQQQHQHADASNSAPTASQQSPPDPGKPSKPGSGDDKPQQESNNQPHDSSSSSNGSKSDDHNPQGSSSSSGGGSKTQEDSSSGSSSSGVEEPPEFLSEWRLSSSEWYGSGLNFVLSSHLDMPQLTTWSFLYKKPPGLFARLIWPKGASFMTRLIAWNFKSDRTLAAPLLEGAHKDFELDGFKEGVRQAICAVMELYAAGDWRGLSPMVSELLLQSMQDAWEQQQDVAGSHGMHFKDARLEVHEVELVCVHSITQQQLAAIDEQRASRGQYSGGDGAVQMWDVAHVYAESTWHATITVDGADVSRDVSVPKSGHWVLCRGPVQLEKVLPADADKPWFMLAWL